MIEQQQITTKEMLNFLKRTKQTSLDLANKIGITPEERIEFQREIMIIDAIIETINDTQYILK
ncbi:hypothetical protein NHG25_05960 [Aerococcaceae bacterium NML191292]|nr:hypothetical protein [Aerococcaceae bacterium NML191292]MCW6665682.1 hypothetical protein [Aerococcaceae bacterium NML191219]MCW6681863.1 hypothetical protein [Aerococcaceae bacterium NML160702]